MTGTTTFFVLRELQGNDPATLNTLQHLLAPYADFISVFWFAVWCTTALVIIVYLGRAYIISRRHD